LDCEKVELFAVFGVQTTVSSSKCWCCCKESEQRES
jgi:hypothetical protein